MDFPVELLPNPNLKLIECNLNNYHLIRYTNFKDIFNPETNNIKIEAICSPREQIEDLSTSLLGVYTIAHSKLDLTSIGKLSFSHYCEPNENIDSIPIYQDDFIVNEEKGHWLILIEKIQNLECLIKRKNKDILAICNVVHTPMRWNYWHFSLRWFLKSENCYLSELDTKEKKAIAGKIGNEARALILEYCTIESSQIEVIAETEYKV